MLLVVPPSSCLLSLLFPFSPSLPVIKLLYVVKAPIALVMKPQIRNRSLPTQDRGQAQGSRSRRARRLSPRCFPGQGWSVSVKTQKRSLWQENLLSTFSAERGRSASTNPTASFSPSSITAPKGSENCTTVESIGGAVCLCTLHVSTCRFLWKW